MGPSLWIRYRDAVNARPLPVTMAALAILSACSSPPLPGPSDSALPSVSVAPGPGEQSPSSSARAIEWSEIEAGGLAPAPREDHTWTVTSDGATAYLFGGRDGANVFKDLWAYHLATDAWSQVSEAGAGPSARFGHNAAWAEGIGLVVFGGQAGADFFNDLWAYDPAANAWRALPGAGAQPVARYGSCAAIGPDDRLWISHGFTSEGQRFADTRAYDFVTGEWTDETPAGDAPIKRCLHACWWTDANALTLYGGQTSGVTALGDLWRLLIGQRPGTNEWQELIPPGALPAERNLTAAARWGAATLVFGGQDLQGEYLADSWWLADANGAATPLTAGGAAPPGRAGAELIADPGRGRMLLFGGRDGTGAFSDLWQLTLPPP